MPSYSRKVSVPGRSSQELYDKISTEIDRFLEKAQVGDTKIDRDAKAKKVSVDSKMFSASLTCLEGAIQLDGKLSLFAAPFRSKIDEGIDKWIAKTFGSKLG